MFDQLITVAETDTEQRLTLQEEIMGLADVEQFFHHHQLGDYKTTNTNYEKWTAEYDTESRDVLHQFIRDSFAALFSMGIMDDWKKLYCTNESGLEVTTRTYKTTGWTATRLSRKTRDNRTKPTVLHPPIASFFIERNEKIDGYEQSMLVEISSKDMTTSINHKRWASEKIVTNIIYRNGFALLKLPTQEEFVCIVQKTTTIASNIDGYHAICKGWGVNTILFNFFITNEIIRKLFSAFVVDTIVNAGTIAFLNKKMRGYKRNREESTLQLGEWYFMDNVFESFNTFFRVDNTYSTSVSDDVTIDDMQEEALDCINLGQDIVILKDSFARTYTREEAHTEHGVVWGKNAIIFFENPISLVSSNRICVEITYDNPVTGAAIDDWLEEQTTDPIKEHVKVRVLETPEQAVQGGSIYSLNNGFIDNVFVVGIVCDDLERFNMFRKLIIPPTKRTRNHRNTKKVVLDDGPKRRRVDSKELLKAIQMLEL
jgi:hypothetical protein